MTVDGLPVDEIFDYIHTSGGVRKVRKPKEGNKIRGESISEWWERRNKFEKASIKIGGIIMATGLAYAGLSLAIDGAFGPEWQNRAAAVMGPINQATSFIHQFGDTFGALTRGEVSLEQAVKALTDVGDTVKQTRPSVVNPIADYFDKLFDPLRQ